MIAMLEFLRENWWWFVPSGGLTAFTVVSIVKWGAKTVGHVASIVQSLKPVAVNGTKQETSVLSTLVEHIPKMSESLRRIAEEVPVHTELLQKIKETNTRIDGRTLKTYNLLDEARETQKRHYKKIDKKLGVRK